MNVADLHRAWIRRLRREWERVNWAWALGLDPPDLALHAGRARLGVWRPGPRVISLSEPHVGEQAWAAVCETLKHEIAHQYVDEVLGGDSAPHGPAFRGVCERMGIGGAATAGPGPPQDDARVRRIRKLLALAEGRGGEHEAQSALAHARRLLLRYNLDLLDVERPPGYVARVLGPAEPRIRAWRRRLGGVLARSFFVETLWTPQYDPAADREVWGLEIGGTAVNVGMAEHVWEFVAGQGQRVWEDWRRDAGPQRPYARLQFLDGVVEGVARRLAADAADAADVTPGEALVWRGDPRLAEWFGRRHPRVRRMRRRGGGAGRPRSAGVQAGGGLRIHRPVEAPSGVGGGLLTGAVERS